MKSIPLLLCLIGSISAFSQNAFKFGKVSLEDLQLLSYEPDPDAPAVALHEFGAARIDNDYNVVFEYYGRFKVLKESGKDKVGNFIIGLYRNGNDTDLEERLASLKAVTYNSENGQVIEEKFDEKNLLTEVVNKYRKEVKVPMPAVRVGSVIEISFVTTSPYLYQFKGWQFQHDFPSAHSEFWAEIPANFNYNINLKGFYKLTDQRIERKSKCFRLPGGGKDGGYDDPMADCSVSKFIMKNIPAFQYEDYLVSDKNYRSALYFELSEYVDRTGRRIKFAETWKDVERQLTDDEGFGVKLKRGARFMDDVVAGIVGNESDPLKRAVLVYDHIKNRYAWNDENDLLTDIEIRKSYEDGRGSSADINLALICGLKAAGLDVSPILASTRDNGIPRKEKANRTDFNYVLAYLKNGDEFFLLDATDPILPFGMIPFRCLNDQGKIFGGDWVPLATTHKRKTAIKMELSLDGNGKLQGELTLQHFGYNALSTAKELAKKDQAEYLRQLETDWAHLQISDYKATNGKDISTSLLESMHIEFDSQPVISENQSVLFSPFFIGRFGKNPFMLESRLYPVDMGAVFETSYYISLVLPEDVKIDDMPQSSAAVLPGNKGKCLFNVTRNGNKVTFTSSVQLSRPVYGTDEYMALKEFFNRIIALENTVVSMRKGQW